jgi:hypothetical protein
MNMVRRAAAGARELWPVLGVALMVALASTFAGAWFDHFHQVNADNSSVKLTTAVPGPGGSQTMAIGDWGVQLVLPLAAEMPAVSFSGPAADSIGLSSDDVSKLGTACRADNNALGALLRLPAGTYEASAHDGAVDYFIATIGGYEYIYRLAATACLDQPGAGSLVNRETSVLREAVSTLAPISK